MMRIAISGFLAVLLVAAPVSRAAAPVDLSEWHAEYTGTAIDYSELLTLDGHSVDRDGMGQSVVVHFWATWCKPCIKEMPTMLALTRRLASQGITVLWVSMDRGGATDVTPFLDKNPELAKAMVVVEGKTPLSKKLAIRIVPTTIIDRNGKEVRRLIGSGEWDGDQGVELAELLKR